LLTNTYNHFDEKDNDLGVILINEPADLEMSKENLDNSRPTTIVDIEGDKSEPNTSYSFNKIGSWEDIQDAFREVVDHNRDIKNVNAIKIKASFAIQLEYHSHYPGHGAKYVNGDYVKYALSPAESNNGKLIPYTFRLSNYIREQENYLNYLHIELQNVLEHNARSSSTKYICITGILFNVFRLRNTGERLAGFDEFVNRNNKYVYSCVNDSKMCVLECLYIANQEDNYKKMRGIWKKIRPRLKD
jgi:hypothetical protein